MTIHLAKPSLRRLVWAIITVAVLAAVITGIALSVAFIKGHNDNGAVRNGDYVRLAVTSLTIWGPIYLLTAWQISVPLVIALGILGGSVRRRPAVTAPDEPL